MITSTTGIGRNWMSSVLVRVLRGYVAAGVSMKQTFDSDFNGRLSCKLLCVVDELREGIQGQRYHRAQQLKQFVTEEHRLINPKYGTQSVQRNCCRWLMFSNHLDALPFENTDRRVEVVANPTMVQSGAYYDALYKALADPFFIAAVRQFLEHTDISSFRAGAHADVSAAKVKALESMQSDVEHRLVDFKEDCTTPLTSRRIIDSAINVYGQPQASAMHITHAIATVGMHSTGRRIKDGNGIRHKVVIVNGAAWTPDMVDGASVQALLQAMELPPFVHGSAGGSGSDSDVPF
jgi:hypothetical protein